MPRKSYSRSPHRQKRRRSKKSKKCGRRHSKFRGKKVHVEAKEQSSTADMQEMILIQRYIRDKTAVKLFTRENAGVVAEGALTNVSQTAAQWSENDLWTGTWRQTDKAPSSDIYLASVVRMLENGIFKNVSSYIPGREKALQLVAGGLYTTFTEEAIMTVTDEGEMKKESVHLIPSGKTPPEQKVMFTTPANDVDTGIPFSIVTRPILSLKGIHVVNRALPSIHANVFYILALSKTKEYNSLVNIRILYVDASRLIIRTVVFGGDGITYGNTKVFSRHV